MGIRVRALFLIAAVVIAAIAESYFSRDIHVLDAVTLSVVAMALFAKSAADRRAVRQSAPGGVISWPLLRRQGTVLGLAGAGLAINLVAVSYYAREMYLEDSLLLWAMGLIMIVLAAARWDRRPGGGSGGGEGDVWTLWEVALLTGLVLLALFFRTYRIDTMPSGLAEDEAPNILDAIKVLEGQVKTPFASGDNWSTSSAYHYMVAFLMKMGFDGFYALKAVSITGGVVAVLMLYLLARTCFHRTVAALAAFFLAVSSWQTIHSRLGYNVALEPGLELITMWFFYRGMRSGRKLDLVLSGIFMGISMIHIRPVSLTPAILAFLVFHRLVLGWRHFRRAQFVSMALPFVLAVLVFLPRAIYVRQNPYTAISRAREVSLLDSTHWSEQKQQPVKIAVTNLKDTLLMFNYRAGFNRLWNVAPFEPAFDLVMATFLILGCGYCLSRWRDPACFLLLATVVVMVIPPTLTLPLDDRPTTRQAVGLVPAVYIFAAIAIQRTWQGLVRVWPRGKIPMVVALAALMGYIGLANYRAYFERMANSPEAWYFSGPVETAIGKYLTRLDGEYQFYVSADASTQPAVRGITYGRAGYEVIERVDDVPIRDPIEKDLAFVFVSSPTRWSWAGLASLLPRLQYYYPGGQYQEFDGIDGKVLWASYMVSKEEALAAQGLMGRYFTDRPGADEAPLSRHDVNLYFLWRKETLPIPLPVHASWEGGLFVPGYGEYTFGVAGLLVQVDGNLLVDSRRGYREARAVLAAGWHALQAQAVVEELPADVFLAWRKSDEGQMRVIPPEMFSALPPPSDHGLLGRYYESGNWTGPALFERLDPIVDFQWPGSEPVPMQSFSVSWQGQIEVNRPGTYRFLTTSDDGSWVYIDGQLVVDNGGRHDARFVEGRIELSAGRHDITVRYFNADGPRGIHLLWAPLGEAARIIPSSVLYPFASAS